ncbi:MAG: NAD(P)/FAD-dependent oxidoreductase [Janthinobacterium lividum]
MTSVDVVVVGAGMAGASAAYEMSATRSVVLLERESQPGYHATGRSAALFSETYGNATIRGLTAASRTFYRKPPSGFATVPLLTPRGVIMVARADQMSRLEAWSASACRLMPTVRILDVASVLAAVPLLRPDYVAGGAIEPGAMDMDVDAIQQGFLRGARARGATLVPGAELLALAVGEGGWTVTTTSGAWHARTVVNAAGAWADAVAVMAGAQPCAMRSMRRTALIVDLPSGTDAARWPMVIDTDEAFYFKPDGGRLLLSPADETPMPPCDVQPDELDIAIAVDRVQQAADLPVRRVVRSWAGLRSFTADRTPVVGFDPVVPDLFWLAGQGGYGIQTAPAMGRLAAALLAGQGVPQDMQALGIGAASLAPGRPGLQADTPRIGEIDG